jgi:hypothetical protein
VISARVLGIVKREHDNTVVMFFYQNTAVMLIWTALLLNFLCSLESGVLLLGAYAPFLTRFNMSKNKIKRENLDMLTTHKILYEKLTCH